ncbi:MAG: CAP domain-containing protein [Saprospiraceae bacterium]|nr:CAP domain-containing protein [Saprospiraceae bacterium]
MLYVVKNLSLIVAGLLLFFQAGAQTNPIIAEGTIQSIDHQGPIILHIAKVRSGNLDPGLLSVEISAGSYDKLYPGLHRFRSQKWLVTLLAKGDSSKYELTSAYGLGTDSSQEDPTTPIFTQEELHNQRFSRASTHAYEHTVVELVNQIRWDTGMLPPLKEVDLLQLSSDNHSESMGSKNFFSHCDWSVTPYTSPSDRMEAEGYYGNSYAENIAAGYATPTSVMQGWMSSSGHRANILSSSNREIGVGYEYDSSDKGNVKFDSNSDCSSDGTSGPFYAYWTQNFGARSTVYPIVIERELAMTNDRSVSLFLYGPGTATSMRMSNDGTNWSGWIPYTMDYEWDLSSGDGLKTVYYEVSTGFEGSGTVYSAEDQIELSGSCDPMVFSNTELNGTQTYNSCEIIADPNVMISGDIIFQAGSVTLGENVEVPENATLEIRIQ